MTTANEVSIIRKVINERLSVTDAAQALHASTRTIWRKVARYQERGADGLIHGLTGRPSNRSKSAHLRRQVVEIYQRDGGDLKLQAFTRLLVEGKGIDVCRETVRQWLMDAGMWKTRKG